jgi:phosphopantothenoylcysteine synthetase/decarboxylase
VPVLYVIACGAGPAANLHELVRPAMQEGWDVYVGTTPAGWDFVDLANLTDLTGHQVRRDYSGRTSGWPQADAIIVAPATINTIDKFAAGIADCWALSVLTECYGHGVPMVFGPNVNPALGRHPRFRANIDELRIWGIVVLWDDPTPDASSWMVPWQEMLDRLPGLFRRPHTRDSERG